MDLHYLEYIVEIANMRSLSRAAENLYITQSTLSQYLSKLEAELGVRLFERKRNEMTLTPAGKLYVAACEEMLGRKKELYNQLADLAQGRTGSFSLGFTPQWGAVAYSNIIGSFREAYPLVQVSVLEETASPLLHALQEGQVDMAIVPLAEDDTLPEGSIFLQTEELLLAIPKRRVEKLPLRESDDAFPSVEIPALAEEPMIFSKKGTTIRKLQEDCFRAKGITPNIILELNSHPASLIMVGQGVGSTFLPRSCLQPSDEVVFAHALPHVHWVVAIMFRKGFAPRQAEKHFISLTKEFFSRLENGL